MQSSQTPGSSQSSSQPNHQQQITQAPAGENVPQQEVKLELLPSRQMPSWLHDEKITLAFSTYQAGKLFFIGSDEEQPGGKIYVFNRTLPRCMGVCKSDRTIYATSLYQIHRFVAPPDSYDRPMYIPQMSYITGDVDAHDLAVEDSGRLVFVNTLFNCLSTVSDTYSFTPIWKPSFISKLVAEDRCHLNGLALRDGEARYVTAVSDTDVVNGWREHRTAGGIVIDIKTNEIVADGLSMPHSPRWHNGSLYVNNAGTGHFGKINFETGKFEEIAFLPGFLRGMAFHKNFAVVGISKCRKDRTFQDLPLDENLTNHKVSARCALMVIDLNTGAIVHQLNIEGIVEEIFDVIILENTFSAKAIGFQTDEIRRFISLDESVKLV